ncbi:MAG: hypothetical protein K6L76_05500 [Agarilytica sp.]
MKYLTPIFVIVISACSSLDEGLQKAVAYGKIQELNQISPEIEKNLYLRLYQSPIYKEDCYIETQGVCKYQYYLSVSTFDEYPETYIYKVKNIGEIKEVTWVSGTAIDSAELGLRLSRYSEIALENNSKLDKSEEKVVLKITPTSVDEITQ